MRYLILIIALLFSGSVFAQATSWIPFDTANGHVRIKIEAGGVESYAIIDSGSQLNGINLSFLEKHELEYDSHKRLKVKGVHGVKTRPIYRDIPTTILGLEMDMELVGIDIGGPDVSVLLGAPLLNQFILQIDYPNSRLRFANRGTFNLAENGNLEIRVEDGAGKPPLVKVNLNNESERWFILDTGSTSGLYMPRIVATSHDWLNKYPPTAGLSRGANNIAHIETFGLPVVGFGPFTLENVRVVVPTDGNPSDFGQAYKSIGTRIRGEQVSGLLGYDVLKHFVLTIDYKKGYAHIHVPEAAGGD